jgi:tetratricopeptide (TPR) repeat protein
MGQMFMDMGELDPATECFLRVVDEDNQNVHAFSCLSKTLAQRKDYQGAIQFLEHVRRLGDDSVNVSADMIRLNLSMYQYSAAARILIQARRSQPADPELRSLARTVHWLLVWRSFQRRIHSSRIYKRIRQWLSGYQFRIRRVINSKRRNTNPIIPVSSGKQKPR